MWLHNAKCTRFWQTHGICGLFESIKDILDGKAGEQHIDYKTKLANRSLPMNELMKSIVQVEFKQIGDFQTKLRSGAFGAMNI